MFGKASTTGRKTKKLTGRGAKTREMANGCPSREEQPSLCIRPDALDSGERREERLTAQVSVLVACWALFDSHKHVQGPGGTVTPRGKGKVRAGAVSSARRRQRTAVKWQ